MYNIQPDFKKATELLADFVEDSSKFQDRFEALYKDINNFIVVNKLENKVQLNVLSLGSALVDYFEDVRRLKIFHNIEHINSAKIVAYTSYWLLQRKPIQLLVEDKNILYVNERFVLAYISDFISQKNKKSILVRSEKELRSFMETLFYNLKYRILNANMLELSILSFIAGEIYQGDITDTSILLEKYSKRDDA